MVGGSELWIWSAVFGADFLFKLGHTNGTNQYKCTNIYSYIRTNLYNSYDKEFQMVLSREQKEEQVQQLTERLKQDKAVFLVNFQGLKVNEIGELRRKLREEKSGYKVVKNTLLKIALKNAKRKVAENLLDQPLALVFSSVDEITPAKTIYNFQKEHEALKIIGGLLEGEFAHEETIKNLAMLPGREELYARIIRSMAAPISGFVSVLRGNLFGIVSVLRQYQVSG